MNNTPNDEPQTRKELHDHRLEKLKVYLKQTEDYKYLETYRGRSIFFSENTRVYLMCDPMVISSQNLENLKHLIDKIVQEQHLPNTH